MKNLCEMKFKIGDKVRVANQRSKFCGATGTVVKIAAYGSIIYVKIDIPMSYVDTDSRVDITHLVNSKYGSASVNSENPFGAHSNDGVPFIKSDLMPITEAVYKAQIKSYTSYYDTDIFKSSAPEIRNVYFNDPLTCVIWKDGTKTFVKNADGDSNYDPEKALAMAISKKALGNKYNYYKDFKKWLPKEDEKASIKDQLETVGELQKNLESFNRAADRFVNSSRTAGELRKKFALLGGAAEKCEERIKIAVTKNLVKKAYLALFAVNDDPTSTETEFATAIEEAIGYLGEALDD